MGETRHETNKQKGQNPFRVPEGYMEGLTERIMSQLPEEKATSEKNSHKLPMITRLRPWIGVAAATVGIVFFINVFIGLERQSDNYREDSLHIQNQLSVNMISEIQSSLDEEYLEYLESRYADYILEEELAYSE